LVLYHNEFWGKFFSFICGSLHLHVEIILLIKKFKQQIIYSCSQCFCNGTVSFYDSAFVNAFDVIKTQFAFNVFVICQYSKWISFGF
jgi:hypothetical protein